MGMFSDLEPLGLLHSALGIALVPIYLIYQVRHFLKVKNQRVSFHYRLGIATALSLLLVILSGIPILPNMTATVSNETIRLVHVVSSFAFLICIAGHLVIVWRVTIGRIGSHILTGNTVR
jgi:uncharacterized membrane protein